MTSDRVRAAFLHPTVSRPDAIAEQAETAELGVTLELDETAQQEPDETLPKAQVWTPPVGDKPVQNAMQTPLPHELREPPSYEPPVRHDWPRAAYALEPSMAWPPQP